MPRWRCTTVADVVLDVADDGDFKDPAKRRDIADGERGTVTDGEHGAATAVDELARAYAPGVADGERGAVAAVVLVVKLGRDCN